MANHLGRPRKTAPPLRAKEKIIAATIEAISDVGTDAITVRNICAKAGISIGTFYHHFKNKDDLLMYFLKVSDYSSIMATTDTQPIAQRITTLYCALMQRCQTGGLHFMKQFFSASNQSLSAYLCEVNGHFLPDTIMAYCEEILTHAQSNGEISSTADVHIMCRDICSITKGCMLEWCLSERTIDMQATFQRIISNYISAY